MFKDPVNPIEPEIRTWAGAQDTTEPMEDWDLILANDARDDLYLELAARAELPRSRYFLHVLYLIVGDEVRFAERPHEPSARLQHLIRAADDIASPEIQRWLQRTKNLVAEPESFSYSAWCGGDLAYERQPNGR